MTMCSPVELNEHHIIAILDTLRTSFKNKCEVKLFDEVAEAAWKTLKLEGTPNPILLENMLIETIEKLYNKPDSELPDDDAQREQARKYDVSLLMFGLLAGYYHTELKSNQKMCVPLKERYDRYLHTNVFTSLEYPSEGNYKEIEAADKKNGRKQPRPLNLIMSIARECKTEISAALLELINSKAYKNCSQKAVFDEKTGQRTDLPKPHFILENFLPKGHKTTILSGSKPINIPEASSTIKRRRDLCMANISIILLGILVMIALFFYLQYATIQKRNIAELERSIAAQERIAAAEERQAEAQETLIAVLRGETSAKDANAFQYQLPPDAENTFLPPPIDDELNRGIASDH